MKNEAERQLATLVSMQTTSDDTKANDEALDYIEEYLASRGMFIKRYRFDGHGALVATTKPNHKTPHVLLAAHVDVVPGSPAVFKLRREGDKLLGRGTFDMKFAIAAYMQLVDDIQNDLTDYDFGIMITTDEEFGGLDGINGTEKLVDKGYLPAVCILPDGGDDWKVETLAKGGWRFDLIAKGKTAHGSRPWEGDSASFKLIHALHDIKQRFSNHGPNTNTLNIGVIQGGKARNQIPELMTAFVEIRLISEAMFEKDRQALDEICQKHDVTYQTRMLKLPAINDPKNRFLKEYVASVQSVTGATSGYCLSYAACDGEYFYKKGIPYIASRPPGGGHHGEHEWINREAFLLLPAVLRDYLDKLAKNTAAPVDTKAALV